jgi:hypothetical protein
VAQKNNLKINVNKFGYVNYSILLCTIINQLTIYPMMTEREVLFAKIEAREELTERERMLQVYSDFHKDAYGFRPRHINYYDFTTEQLKADFDHFREVCDENARLEEIAEAKAVAEFKAQIQRLIDMGAGDEETALRWLADSQDGWDAEQFLWSKGVLFTDYGRELAVKLQPMFTERWLAREGK